MPVVKSLAELKAEKQQKKLDEEKRRLSEQKGEAPQEEKEQKGKPVNPARAAILAGEPRDENELDAIDPLGKFRYRRAGVPVFPVEDELDFNDDNDAPGTLKIHSASMSSS